MHSVHSGDTKCMSGLDEGNCICICSVFVVYLYCSCNVFVVYLYCTFSVFVAQRSVFLYRQCISGTGLDKGD